MSPSLRNALARLRIRTVDFSSSGELPQDGVSTTSGTTVQATDIGILNVGDRQKIRITSNGNIGGGGTPSRERPLSPSEARECAPAGATNGPVGGEVRISSPDDTPTPIGLLTAATVSELARIYDDRSTAAILAESAGMAPGQIPWGAHDALGFWHEIARRLANGAVEGGAERLVDAALEEYPANQILLEARRRMRQQRMTRPAG